MKPDAAATPDLTDGAGPWLPYPDAIERIRRTRKCSEASAEIWMHGVTASRQLQGRCLYYKLPHDHPRHDLDARREFPNTPSMHREHDWVDPLDREPGGQRWEPADMRKPWVQDYTEWNAGKLDEILGIRRKAPSKQRKKPGAKPKYPWNDWLPKLEAAYAGERQPKREAVIASLEHIVKQSGGKTPSPRSIGTKVDELIDKLAKTGNSLRA